MGPTSVYRGVLGSKRLVKLVPASILGPYMSSGLDLLRDPAIERRHRIANRFVLAHPYRLCLALRPRFLRIAYVPAQDVGRGGSQPRPVRCPLLG